MYKVNDIVIYQYFDDIHRVPQFRTGKILFNGDRYYTFEITWDGRHCHTVNLSYILRYATNEEKLKFYVCNS